jgi:hypothetical protein
LRVTTTIMKPTSGSYFAELIDAAGSGWNRFWFTPSDPLPCSMLRISVGLLIVVHWLTLIGQLDRWYASNGVLPPASVRTLVQGGSAQPYYHPSYFNYLGPTESRIVHFLAIAAAASFAAGLFSRVTGVLTLIALLAYFHRLPLLAAHVEPVLIFLVAYLTIGPADAYCSLSRWLASLRGQGAAPREVAPSYWATLSLRLIQVHLAAFVLMMGLSKLNGDTWWEGEAIWHLLAQTHSRPLDLTFLRGFELLVNFWTHAVVYIELAFPVLVGPRLTRPLILAAAAAVWLSLVLATGLWLFSLTLIIASLAFVPAQAYRNRR